MSYIGVGQYLVGFLSPEETPGFYFFVHRAANRTCFENTASRDFR